MAIDNFDLRVAIKEIEGQQSDMALRWVMLKMWLDKQEYAQQYAHPTLGESATSQAVPNAESLSTSDGVPPSAPAQVA